MIACAVCTVRYIGFSCDKRTHIASDLNISCVGNIENNVLIVAASVGNRVTVDLRLCIVVKVYASLANNIDKALRALGNVEIEAKHIVVTAESIILIYGKRENVQCRVAACEHKFSRPAADLYIAVRCKLCKILRGLFDLLECCVKINSIVRIVGISVIECTVDSSADYSRSRNTVTCEIYISADSDISSACAVADINIAVIVRIVSLYENIISACIAESGNDLSRRLRVKLRIFVCMYISCRIVILVRIAAFDLADTIAVAVHMIGRICREISLGSISLRSRTARKKACRKSERSYRSHYCLCLGIFIRKHTNTSEHHINDIDL